MNRFINVKSLSLVYTIGYINKAVKSIWYRDDIVHGILEGVLYGTFWPLSFHYIKWSDIIFSKDKELIRLNNELVYWRQQDSEFDLFNTEVKEAVLAIADYKQNIRKMKLTSLRVNVKN